ncbi:DNA (cytosine-5)-methyltransferase 3B, partial [Stegodyphus mimosarum]
MFRRGDLVWGKMKTYPWWPAIILDAKDCGKKQSKNKMWLFWFGDNKISELECERIVTFEDNYLKNASKRSGNLFKTAVQEILKVKAYQQHLALDDISSLHEWAVSGFKNSSISCSIKKYEINGLPEIVINALENLQSKNINDDDSDDDDEKDPVFEVQRGLKMLHG